MQLIAQGDTTNVLTTRGDIINTRLLTNNKISNWYFRFSFNNRWFRFEFGQTLKVVMFIMFQIVVLIVMMVHNITFKTINYALSQSTSGDVIEINTITGGTGGTHQLMM